MDIIGVSTQYYLMEQTVLQNLLIVVGKMHVLK